MLVKAKLDCYLDIIGVYWGIAKYSNIAERISKEWQAEKERRKLRKKM